MNQQRNDNRLKPDKFEKALLIFIATGLIFIIGLQIGISKGREDGKRIGRAEVWSEHYDQFSKVKWVFDEADLRRMYENH